MMIDSDYLLECSTYPLSNIGHLITPANEISPRQAAEYHVFRI